MPMVEVHNLTKNYGKLTAVDDLSFSAEKGRILALVGPDGAGKTSAFRAACGLIEFDSGTITIAGHDIKKQFDSIKPLLGYMPQIFSLYPDLSVEENLFFYAGLFGIDKIELKKRAERLYEFSGLGPFASRRAEALSGGMKQKLALSCNLIHDPEVLILDEPTTGVDPLSRRQFWDILRMLKDDGSAIIVSTPYMDEVALADNAIFIHEGKKLAEGRPTELTAHFTGDTYQVNYTPTVDQLERLNKTDGLSARRFGSSLHIYIDSGYTMNQFQSEFELSGIDATRLKTINPDLEDTFIQLMSGK
jgi:drug efflux transport system ATP-binding protein